MTSYELTAQLAALPTPAPPHTRVPRCGTTWTTQVCHQLRCLKAPKVDAMEFGEITEVGGLYKLDPV
jgi:hypothetical protein